MKERNCLPREILHSVLGQRIGRGHFGPSAHVHPLVSSVVTSSRVVRNPGYIWGAGLGELPFSCIFFLFPLFHHSDLLLSLSCSLFLILLLLFSVFSFLYKEYIYRELSCMLSGPLGLSPARKAQTCEMVGQVECSLRMTICSRKCSGHQVRDTGRETGMGRGLQGDTERKGSFVWLRCGDYIRLSSLLTFLFVNLCWMISRANDWNFQIRLQLSFNYPQISICNTAIWRRSLVSRSLWLQT